MNILVLPALLTTVLATTSATASSSTTNSISTNRVLLVERSSASVSGGKATLAVGRLERTNDIYAGDYQVKVTPYFFKSEKGKLAIVVSNENLARVNQGLAIEFTGTATANGKNGHVRRVDGIATPLDTNHGTLKLWFNAKGRKMTFLTAYRFDGP